MASPIIPASVLEWGIRAQYIGGQVLWGARAILDERGRHPFLDILPDRVSWAWDPNDKTARKLLIDAMNGPGGALEKLRAMVADRRITEGNAACFIQDENTMVYWRAAGGYVYLTITWNQKGASLEPTH